MNVTEAMKEVLREYPKDFLQQIAKHPVENYLDGNRACSLYVQDGCG